MKPALVVLAAGIGSRYGGLKQMDGIGPSGETIIDYSIYDALKAGFEKIVFVIRKEIEDDFKNLLSKKYESKAEIHYVFQEINKLPEGFEVPEGRVKPWGTAHAVLMAEAAVNEPFAMINGDDFYGRNSFKAIYDHLIGLNDDKLAACMVGYKLNKTLSEHGHVSRGVCSLDNEGNLAQITERTHIYKKGEKEAYYVENEERHELTGQEFVSMNLMGFSANVFDLINAEFKTFLEQRGTELKSEFYIPFILDQVKEKGNKVPVIGTDESWFGITYPEDKASVQAKIQELVEQGVYPARLWE